MKIILRSSFLLFAFFVAVNTSFASYICDYNYYDCSDFEYYADPAGEAQNVYDYCKIVSGYDVHWLDSDKDGIACDTFSYGGNYEYLLVSQIDSLNNDIVVVKDDQSVWYINYGFGCSYLINEGDTIVGKYSSSISDLDSIGSELVIPDTNNECSINDAYKVTHTIPVIEVRDGSVVTSFDGVNQYILDYGYGCTFMDSYEGGSIYLYAYDYNNINPITDYLVLPSGDGKCNIDSIQAALSLEDIDEICKNSLGIHSYLNPDMSGDVCLCEDGYEKQQEVDGTYECLPIIDTTIGINDTDIFYDVSSDHKNFIAIQYLVDNGVLQGYPDGTFKPSSYVNRAELLKIILEGKKITPNIEVFNNCFSDVGSEWFANYVCYAKAEGWIEGYDDGTFKPGQTVNKVEAIKMLLESNSIELQSLVTEKPFEDVDIVDWFAKYISKAKELGILEETGLLFEPGLGMTRAGISENLYRLLILQ